MPKCPYRVGQTFMLALGVLGKALERASCPDPVPGSMNYRAPDEDPELDALADSIAQVGQLQPVLVYWTGTAFAIAAGFRRVSAMIKHAKRHRFLRVECKRVASDQPDLVRLAENFDREDPTSYETCRYLAELAEGRHGAARKPVEIAATIGVSVQHVRNMIRFYRNTPELVREAWRRDRDGRFTFRVLSEIAKLADVSEAQFAASLARVLGVAPTGVASAPDGGLPTSDRRGDTADTEPGEEPQAAQRRQRGLGKSGARALAASLDEAGGRVKDDDRALVVRDLLLVFAGQLPAKRAAEIVETILQDLGVGADAPAEGAA